MNIGLFSIGAGRAARPEVLVYTSGKPKRSGLHPSLHPSTQCCSLLSSTRSSTPTRRTARLQVCAGTPTYSTPFWRSPGRCPHHDAAARHGHLPRAAAQPADDRPRGRHPGCAVGRAVYFRGGIGWLKEEFQALECSRNVGRRVRVSRMVKKLMQLRTCSISGARQAVHDTASGLALCVWLTAGKSRTLPFP